MVKRCNPAALIKAFNFGDPFEEDPADAEVYYATLGRVFVMWGRFEQSLEQLIAHLGNLLDAPKLPPAPPRPLTGKLNAISKLFRNTPSLGPLIPEALEIVKRAEDAAEARNRLIHANWQGFDHDASELTMTFAKLEWDGLNSNPEKRDVSLSELESLARETHSLSAAVFRLMVNGSIRVSRAKHATS